MRFCRIGPDLELAAEPFHPCSHGGNPDSHEGRFGAVFRASGRKAASVVADRQSELLISHVGDNSDLGGIGMAENIRESFLDDPQHRMLAFMGQPINTGVDTKGHAQRRPRSKAMGVALDRGLQPLRHQALRMQQVGKRPDFPQRFVDRCINIVAKSPVRLDRTQAGADTHQAETRGDQMLTGRVMKFGRYPLLDAFLNGGQVLAVSKAGDVVRSPFGCVREYAVMSNESDNGAVCTVEDGNDCRLDVPPDTSERQVVMSPGFGSLCETCLEDLTEGF